MPEKTRAASGKRRPGNRERLQRTGAEQGCLRQAVNGNESIGAWYGTAGVRTGPAAPRGAHGVADDRKPSRGLGLARICIPRNVDSGCINVDTSSELVFIAAATQIGGKHECVCARAEDADIGIRWATQGGLSGRIRAGHWECS